jgi:ABC-type nickel/cobalt efflux system permease component RcnA
MLALLIGPIQPLRAHPVPRRAHDRTILVKLGPDKVIVDYRLEVDEITVVYDDLPAFNDQIDLTRLTKPDEFYDAFTRFYAPVLAGNLNAKLDGKSITFTCLRRTHTLVDEEGKKLGHLRCDFLFEGRVSRREPDVKTDLTRGIDGSPRHAHAATHSPQPHIFDFRETNYELEDGQIRLSLQAQNGIDIQSKIEPDKKLQEMPPSELRPGDNAKLRTVTATFTISPEHLDSSSNEDQASKPSPAVDNAQSSILDPSSSSLKNPPSQPGSLLDLLLDPNRGIWFLLLLAGFFGAVHALAPGHGKTLVAAYLVGERGTVWHALILGLVTTISHTGAVLVLAGILLFINPDRLPNLELFGGLPVAGMGLWLLLRRLAGQADHVHLGGHGHHNHHHHDHSHEHDQADHYHDDQGHAHPMTPSPTVGGWWGLIALGISGGIIPCYDAIVMLIFAISARRLWLALPLLLAFSAGLAGVLIVIGILVVQVKGFASTRLRAGRWSKFLPIASAVLVIILGLFLCYRSVHPT